MSLIRHPRSIPTVIATSLLLLAASCASVPASRVRTVRERKDVPMGSCGYMGRVTADAAAETPQADLELRTQAGKLGANTVLVLAGRPGPVRGKAYFCQPRSLDPSRSAFATGNGTDGTYGPNVAPVEPSTPAVQVHR